MVKNPTTPTTLGGLKIDWVQCTESDPSEDVLPLSSSKFYQYLLALGYQVSDFEENQPRNFYECGLTIGRYLNIYFNREKNVYTGASVLFSFTGQGSTDLALKLSKYYQTNDFDLCWRNFFKVVEAFGSVSFKRIDLANDDFTGMLDFAKIERKLERKEFTAHKKTFNIVKSKKTNGTLNSETVYIGARQKHQNGFLVRIYDKRAEYLSKGDKLPIQVDNLISGEGSHYWVRCELEIKGKACDNLVAKYLAGKTFGELFSGLLANAILFKKVSKSNKNKAYWPVADWWANYLGKVEQTSLTDPERDLDLSSLLKWIRKAVAPSLALIQEIGDKKGFDFYEILKSLPETSFSKKQERLKNQALELPQEKIDDALDIFKRGAY